MAPLATRVISGKGLVQIDKTTSDFKKAKVLTVYADIVRLPSQEYLNYNYNSPRGRYATLVFYRGGYAIAEQAMEFPKQSWDFYPDISAQNLYAIICSYQGVLESFVNLGVALGVTPISVVNRINLWRHQDLFFDSIRVVCYADTAIRVVVESFPFSLCPDQANPTPDPPPPPPSAPPTVPKGTPMTIANTPISNPYTNPNDSGNTIPFPGDAPNPSPNAPGGSACAVYRVDCTVRRRTTSSGAESNFAYIFMVRAPITGYFLVNQGGTGRIRFQCRGANQFTGGAAPACLAASTLVEAASQANTEFLYWVVEPTFTLVG